MAELSTAEEKQNFTRLAPALNVFLVEKSKEATKDRCIEFLQGYHAATAKAFE